MTKDIKKLKKLLNEKDDEIKKYNEKLTKKEKNNKKIKKRK